MWKMIFYRLRAVVARNKLARKKYLRVRRFLKGSLYKSYFDSSRSVFIHIPKAAGKSVASALYGDDKPGHYYASDYMEDNLKKFQDYFVFTFVREPSERLKSAYYFLLNGGSTHQDNEIGEILASETSSFEDFVINWLDEDKIYYWHHFVPQYEFFSYRGEVVVDFIGRHESIDSDYYEVSQKIGVSKTLGAVNVGKSRGGEEVSREVKDKIRFLYAKDYSILGY